MDDATGYRDPSGRPVMAYARRVLLGIAMMACMVSAHATDDTIEVGPNLLQSILNQINTYAQRFQDYDEYAEQAARWQQTLAQYQQQLVKIQGMLSGYDLPKSEKLEKVLENYLVKERCSQDGGGFSSEFKLNQNANYLTEQQQICVNIRIIENRKYNSTVDYLVETAPKVMELLKQAEAQRQSSNEQGNVQASTNDAVRINNELQAQGQIWMVQMQAYDAYIASMTENQKMIVKSALKGEQNPLGTLAKTAALKAALSD
jgi:hypothetical protein